MRTEAVLSARTIQIIFHCFVDRCFLSELGSPAGEKRTPVANLADRGHLAKERENTSHFLRRNRGSSIEHRLSGRVSNRSQCLSPVLNFPSIAPLRNGRCQSHTEIGPSSNRQITLSGN